MFQELSIPELDVSLLPKENIYFKIVSGKLENYVKKFDTEYFIDFYGNQSLKSSPKLSPATN